MAGEQGSHGLDSLFQAHLPEFLQVLSAGLSPIKQHKKALDQCAESDHAAGRATLHSPTASGLSSGMQRSFSAVELHDAALGLPAQQQPLLHQHRPGHKRAASTDATASCWTDGCSSGGTYGGVGHSPCSSIGSASPEVDSAAAAGSGTERMRRDWLLHCNAPTAPADAEQVPVLQQRRLPPCPVLWRPAPSLVQGMPVAEGVESTPSSPAAAAAFTGADGIAGQPAVQQQQQLNPWDPAAQQPVAQQEPEQRQQQAASAPSSPAASSSRGSYVRSSSIANLMQMLHGLLGTPDSSSKLQVQVPPDSDGLDVREYINCYSPDATTRQASRANSKAHGLTHGDGGKDLGGSSNRSSPAGSPRASGSFPDLRLFWGNYSQAGSKTPSRQPSAVQAAAQEQQPEQQHIGQPHSVSAAAAPAALLPAASGPTAGADAQGGGAHRVVPLSPSPSKRSILLHGPSRLSLRTSVHDAAAAEGAQQEGAETVQQSAMQEQQQGPLQHHAPQLPRRSEAGDAAAEPMQPAAGQQAAKAMQPQDQQQHVQRQLFTPPHAAQHPGQAPQQQQQGAQQVQPLPVASPSAAKKQSMLWSMMHRKGSSSSSHIARTARGVFGSAADGAASKAPSTASLLSTQHSVTCAVIAASCDANNGDAAGVQQCLSAPAQHDRAPAACVAAAVNQAASAAAGLVSSSGAADVMAASMDRIASCLEDYLCDRSPSVSPTRERPAQHTSSSGAAAAGAPAAPCNSPGWLDGRDQGQGPSHSTAGDAVQHVTPKKLAAGLPGSGVSAGPLPAWSPAAAAAKARMMAALSPCKQAQQELTGPVVGRATGSSAQHVHTDQNGIKEAAGVAVGWLHPCDLRPAAAVQRATQRQQQQQGAPLLPQPAVQPGAGVAHLPHGLCVPPGLGLCTEQQQLQSHAVPAAAAAEAAVDATAAAAGDSEQLASLFALACRAVGVDLLQADQQAAAPAVTAAALTAAMAAAATAYQQQQAALQGASHTAGSCQLLGTQARRVQRGQRTMLWRPEGCGAACSPELNIHTSSSSQAWVQATFAQIAAPAGAACAAECDLGQQLQQPSLHRSRVHGLGQSSGGLTLWRQQQQSSVVARVARSPRDAPHIRMLQPERASHLRLLRPGQHSQQFPTCQSDSSLTTQQPATHSITGQPGSFRTSPQQQSRHWHRPEGRPASPLQQAPPPGSHKLVRLPVQQQPAAPLRPRVLVCSGQPVPAPWQHPLEDGMQQAVSTATGHVTIGTSTLQQPTPCQTAGWTARNEPLQQGGAAAGSGLCAGAAATRLLQGLLDHSTQQTTGRTAGSNQYWSATQDVQPHVNLTAVPGTYARQLQPGGAVWVGGIGGDSGVQVQSRTQGAPLPQTWPAQADEAAGQPLFSTAAATGGLGGTCEPAQPARVVVIDTLPPQQQEQQQCAPWQQEAQAGFTNPGQQADPTQHQPGDAAAQAQLVLPPPTQQQQQKWQVTFPVPLSPVKSPRKHPAGRRWALLQKLKAVNRGKAAAAVAGKPGKSDAAAQLVAQLQQLMQGPAGAVQVTAGADCSKDSWRPDLDAAAAMSLHAQPQPQPCDVTNPQQQQGDNDQGLGAAGGCPPQASGSAADVSGQLAAQVSLHSAGAQTSEVMGQEPSAPMADASVQAASVTAEAGIGSEQQQEKGQCQQGALELAQLILVAVEKSGGVILPEAGELTCSRMVSAAGGDDGPGTLSGMQQLQQGGSWGLLPNPFAGTAAPQFQQVVDLQPDAFFESRGPNPAPAELLVQEDGLQGLAQQGMQQYAVLYEEVQQQQPSQQYVSSRSNTQHGCCFAACPRHISSPELGESAQPQQQHVSRRTGGLTSSSSRIAGGTKAQQQPQQGSVTGAGRSLVGAPSLARSTRPSTASARQLTARTSKASSRRLSDPQAAATAGQQASRQQQQQQLRRQSSNRQAATQQDTGSKVPVSPNTWACEQTKQLDELWQQWQQQQQVKTLAAAGDQPQQQADAQQELLAAKERQELEAAYARASAARSSAKKAAQHAAASRSQRLRAELMDLGRMLAEVDTLAAQMERESTQAAAAVEQFEADLNSRNRQPLRTSAAGGVGMCAV